MSGPHQSQWGTSSEDHACTNFNGSSSSCGWDTAVWNEVVDQLTDRQTVPFTVLFHSILKHRPVFWHAVHTELSLVEKDESSYHTTQQVWQGNTAHHCHNTTVYFMDLDEWFNISSFSFHGDLVCDIKINNKRSEAVVIKELTLWLTKSVRSNAEVGFHLCSGWLRNCVSSSKHGSKWIDSGP